MENEVRMTEKKEIKSKMVEEKQFDENSPFFTRHVAR